MALRRNRGYLNQDVLLDVCGVPVTRFLLSRWEKILAANLLLLARMEHKASDQRLKAFHNNPAAYDFGDGDAVGPRPLEQLPAIHRAASWSMHGIECDGTNVTAVHGLKCHGLCVRSRFRICGMLQPEGPASDEAAFVFHDWEIPLTMADLSQIPPECKSYGCRALLAHQLAGVGTPHWLDPSPNHARGADHTNCHLRCFCLHTDAGLFLIVFDGF